jgi:hypothetical protein
MKYRFQCAECGYAYKSLWYEPNWVAKRFYTADHNSFHYTSWANDYPSQWKRHGAELEQERIIELISNYNLSACCFQPDCCLKTDDLIALIKGEK